MSSLFVQAVDDFAPLRRQLDALAVQRRTHPAHLEYVFEDELVIDRAATGLRHALWYSCVAAVRDAKIVQHDKHQLRLVAVHG
jgi:hypothetical protein